MKRRIDYYERKSVKMSLRMRLVEKNYSRGGSLNYFE